MRPSPEPGSRDANEYQHLAPLFGELVAATDPVRRRVLRERLVTGHLPLAEHIALRYRRRGQPEEDLRQVAFLGLVQAVGRFDPARGTDFLSFAVPTITGEIRRYFRDATWSMRVPRRLKELHAALSAATERFGQQHGRAPRPSELATLLDLSLDEVHEGLQVGHAYISQSLDELVYDVQPRGFESDAELLTVENREVLAPALATLPEREAAIIRMRFFDNLSQTQIAERVGLSQMHISRLLARSLRTLRDHLTTPPVEPAGAMPE